MDENFGIGKGESLTGGAPGKEQRPHAGCHTDTYGAHVRLNYLHRVVNRQALGHNSARGVYVEVDILLGILFFQKQQARDDRVRKMFVDRSAQNEYPVLQK